MNDSDEEWKPVVGFESLYLVSSRGRMRRMAYADGRTADHILHGYAGTHGYLMYDLQIKPIRVRKAMHQIVAHAFLGEPPPGLQVNHLDGNKMNNRADNLAYVTHRENMAHAWSNGLIYSGKGKFGDWQNSERGKMRLRQKNTVPEETIWHIKNLPPTESNPAAAKRLGVSRTTISRYRSTSSAFSKRAILQSVHSLATENLGGMTDEQEQLLRKLESSRVSYSDLLIVRDFLASIVRTEATPSQLSAVQPEGAINEVMEQAVGIAPTPPAWKAGVHL